MKTPEQWCDEHLLACPRRDAPSIAFIRDVQQDALTGQINFEAWQKDLDELHNQVDELKVQLHDAHERERRSVSSILANQEEMALVKDVSENLNYQNELLKDEVNRLKDRLVEQRRYLRAANKGAERNAVALALSASRYHDLREADERYKDREKLKHEVIVWNWLIQSDEELKMKLGELSSYELSAIRLFMRFLLGTKILKHL